MEQLILWASEDEIAEHREEEIAEDWNMWFLNLPPMLEPVDDERRY